MPKVDFYTIKQNTQEARALFACRLIEKAYNLGHRIYVHTANENDANAIDDLLWSFKPESFLPHAIAGDMDEEDIPIVIGHGPDHQGPTDLLVNLSSEIPPFHARFARIGEIVIDDETAKQTSRRHWKEYQRLGYELQHHQL